jgi:hypothetical protein
VGKRRNALAAVIRQELAVARGTARAVLAAAEEASAEAERQRQATEESFPACIGQLTAEREVVRTDILRRYRAESEQLTEQLGAVAAQSAPGAAGTPWRMWTPTDPGPDDRPGLLRIGTIGVEAATVPGLVPLLDAAHLAFDGAQPDVDGVISGLLLRAIGSTLAGDVQLTVYDPEQLGHALAPFAPLGNAGLLGLVGPGGLSAMLDELVEHICRVNEGVLAGGYASLAELTAATTGRRPEPWRLVVLLADPVSAAELTGAQRSQLDRIVRSGVACGVHLIVRGLDLTPHPSVQRIAVRGGSATCAITGELSIRLDGPPPAERVAAFCRSMAERLQAGPPPARLADLEPDKLWLESSAYGLIAPIGDSTDGSLVEVPLGDDPPHALIGGPSGSGKTNLIYAWVGSLAARYDPEELALYLLDFTAGVSFARFTPGPRDPSWLPQVRLAGVNVHADHEFGLAMLRHLGGELRARAQAAKRHEAANLAELRAADPAGHWPRIVAVLDEFQVLMAGRDAVADEAVTLLEDLAHRGQSQGIHLVLASHGATGIEALDARTGLLRQFTLRIALPKAHRILADNNLAAAVIPRFHAVVNAESGAAGANRIVRLPDAGDRVVWRGLQRKLWHARPDSCVPPRLFDGDTVPRLPGAYRPTGWMLHGVTGIGSSPGAVLGERMDVAARPARLRLGRMPGRNLAVLGTRADEACDVLASAALSLASQGPAHFSVVCLEPSAQQPAARLAAELPDADYYGADDVDDLFDLTGDDIPHYVLGYALDAAGPRHRDRLRTLLADGPERRTHVLGWWRSVARLRDDLGGPKASLDPIGAWVALDVSGVELSPLCPQPGGPVWHPRVRRALFFDRSVHRCPEVIIPYEVNSDT